MRSGGWVRRALVIAGAVFVIALAVLSGLAMFSETHDIELPVADARMVFGALLGLLPLLVIADFVQQRASATAAQLAEYRTVRDSLDTLESDYTSTGYMYEGLLLAFKEMDAEQRKEAHEQILGAQARYRETQQRFQEAKRTADTATGQGKQALSDANELLISVLAAGVGLIVALYGLLAPTTNGVRTATMCAVVVVVVVLRQALEKIVDQLPNVRRDAWVIIQFTLVLIVSATVLALLPHISVLPNAP